MVTFAGNKIVDLPALNMLDGRDAGLVLGPADIPTSGPYVAPVGAFAFQVITDNTGTSTDVQFALQLRPGDNYNFDWETSDGQSGTHIVDTDLLITFPLAGTYTIALGGDGNNDTIPSLHTNDEDDNQKWHRITQWGSIAWTGGQNGGWEGMVNMQVSALDFPDFSLVTSMDEAFRGNAAMSMLSSDTASIDWSGVLSCKNCFRDCAALIDSGIASFDISSTATMANFLHDCTLWDGDCTGWGTNIVTAWSECFNNSGYSGGGIGGLINITAVAAPSMFRDCNLTTDQDVTGWDFQNITNASSMFRDSDFNGSGGGTIDTGSLENASSMFLNTPFNRDISTADITSITSLADFLKGTPFSNANYDLLLVAWEAQAFPSGITAHFGTAKYDGGAPATARANLISNGWTITDGGQVLKNVTNSSSTLVTNSSATQVTT